METNRTARLSPVNPTAEEWIAARPEHGVHACTAFSEGTFQCCQLARGHHGPHAALTVWQDVTLGAIAARREEV